MAAKLYNCILSVFGIWVMTPSPNSPPTNTSPYQSRLFTFLNRQRWAWRDRFTQMTRSVQNSVTWGGQVLLYPVYLAIQLGRGVRLRLVAAVGGRPKFPQKQELPPCDHPIRNTLEQLQELVGDELEVLTQPSPALPTPTLRSTLPQPTLEPTRPTPALQPPLSTPTLTNPIRAIASTLPSQQLVLVDTANQVQDCLTPIQQQTLSQRIYQELLATTHQRYLLQVHAQQYRIPQQFRQNPQLWPPVQRFWRLMHWLQVSPAATATNLFGEAEFAEVLALPPGPDLPLGFQFSPPPDNRLVLQMDEAIAALEQQQAELNAQLNQWWQTEAATATNPLTKLRKTVQLGLGVLLGTTDLATLNPEPLNAESAVWVNWEELTDHSRDQFISLVPPDASVIEAEMALDLSWQAEINVLPQPSSGIPTTASSSPLPKRQTTVGLRTALASTSASTTVVPRSVQTPTQPASPDVADIWEQMPQSAQAPEQPGLVTARSRRQAAQRGTTDLLARTSKPPTDPTHRPDWIEVESQAAGYEVHFFAQVLNSFDRVMVVIEEFVLALWRWLKQLLVRLW